MLENDGFNQVKTNRAAMIVEPTNLLNYQVISGLRTSYHVPEFAMLTQGSIGSSASPA